MQIALAAADCDQRALISEHELRVCGLRTEIFEANEREKRLKPELGQSASTSALRAVGGEIGQDRDEPQNLGGKSYSLHARVASTGGAKITSGTRLATEVVAGRGGGRCGSIDV